MRNSKIGLRIIVAHEDFHALIQGVMQRADIAKESSSSTSTAHLLLDLPLTWALGQLERLNSVERARTVVVTQGQHPAYLDTLASFHISGVVTSLDERTLLSRVYAAASALKTYQWKSGLTYMELRVTRLLLAGMGTEDVADRLRVSGKTVNAHISNVLVKLGYENRAQYIAAVLGNADS